MASRIRTIDFLPEIFRTETNDQFFRSTLDQLVQNPKLKPTQGYIGRRVGPGVDPKDNYVLEPSIERTNYQLEPGVTFLKENNSAIENVLTYPGLIDTLRVNGANVDRYDRLFNSEHYSWDPFVDFDKFVNFGQYYWLPEGPDRVNVSSSNVPLTDDFDVSRTNDGYTFSGQEGNLPTITLVREGSYTFDVNQLGNSFWIQSVPGSSGVLPQTPNQSSREVLGVTNNGDDVGTITFNVPSKRAQNFFFELENAGNASLATDLKFDQINNIFLDQFIEEHGGIDGIQDLDGRTLIFLNQLNGENSGWSATTQFDTNTVGYDAGAFDNTTEIGLITQRYSVWRIELVYDENEENPYISLSVDRPVSNLNKLLIEYGEEYSNISFYKTAEGYFEQVPLITANLDILYYQDGTDDNKFGIIKLVDQVGDQTLDIDDILGKIEYTSPNGVRFTNGLKVQFEGSTNPENFSGEEYYVEGVGTSIKLVPVSELITPETYTESSSEPFDQSPFDTTAFDDSLNAPQQQDYLTISRASIDRNPWSRSNRWFHINVINDTAEYNGVDAVINDNFRAKRPILEFRNNLRLFNFGTSAILPIDIIDFNETDAFSNINGTIGYSVDGYSLIDGSKIIFAADRDPAVRNKVYLVKFVQFDDSSNPVIDLQPADITTPGNSTDQVTVCVSGITLQGKSFRFDGNSWTQCQEKVSTNQAPLFDVYDLQGISYGDTVKYPGTSFNGTKLFSYAVGSGVTDTVIGQPLKYLTINNVGDIVFENNLYKDSFVYVDDTISVSKEINDGTVRQYNSISDYTNLIGWQTSFTDTTSRQSLSFVYDGNDLILDVLVNTNTAAIPVKVFVDGAFLLPNKYTFATNSEGVSVISFIEKPSLDSVVEVSVISKEISLAGYYTVPDNLQNNAINENPTELTLGTVRNHYESICQNLVDFDGSIHGSNNTRDLGNLVIYGEKIMQQSSPLTFASVFLYDKNFEYFSALDYSAKEYEKYKNLILETVARNDWGNSSARDILDECFDTLNIGKNQLTPFYWTDVIPCGQTFEETVYTVTPISDATFDTLYSYDFTSANYQAILVYLNDEILVGDSHEYTVATDGPRVTILVPLQNGDKITIREYQDTAGSFVPATPSSLGLYPAYEPAKYLDDTYIIPTDVILGHDGSKTVAFGDIRDDVLLEFEKRIYSNIKAPNKYNPALRREDVVPGFSRETDYSLAEVTEILGESFLTWVGWNKLPYREQNYLQSNPFTWNYSSSSNKLDGSTLAGGWRSIYFNLYDTDTPHTTPWEMLGFTEEPDWWSGLYGPAPYTSGNKVLWDDLAAGKVADPAGEYTLTEYQRPRLNEIIPVDSEGNLLPPIDVVVGSYDQNSFRKSWTVGDLGSVETAWQRSSAYPFAIQRLLALTKPAQYFSLFVDTDQYLFNTEYSQYLLNERFRVSPENIEIYGDNVAKHSYINFIVDFNRISGLDSTSLLETRLKNLNIQLTYRLASFSDQQYLKIFSEKSSPNSLNSSLLLPDESYQLKLYKNPAFAELIWSSIIVQKTANGWTVFGYSSEKPYFNTVNSLASGRFVTITVGDDTVKAARDFGNRVVRVPYGFEFTSKSSVVDFLLSYGEYMSRQGMTFDTVENNTVLSWVQMSKEFLYWSEQGWAEGAIINLNPNADKVTVTRDNAVAESLIERRFDVMLNQNRKPLKNRDYVVERLDNNLTLRALNNNTFSYLRVRFTAYEHAIIFDNTSVFNDLIYQPSTGSRQTRLLLNGFTTYEWNGTLDAQGFILNEDNVEEWKPNQSYSKGQIVLYKDAYWSAAELTPPKEEFDFNLWIKSDYQKITKGLLPNLATKSDLMLNYYDTNTANLERDADLLGFGLIGFRPRQYMQNLNLDDISQVNLYKQFLDIKGTTQAAEIFSRANLEKEVAEYEILENWAINRATYGANAVRRYYEIKLIESNLLGNPSTVSVVDPQESSTANQTVLLQNIYKQSTKLTDKNILPTLVTDRQDIALPSAGYVNFDDVDVKVFEFNDLSQIESNLQNVELGSTIWVAKSNNFDWNIYRTNLVSVSIQQVTDNLNGTCTFTFAGNHGLNINNRIVVKGFDTSIDGAYQVRSVPGLKSITVNLSLPGDQTTLTGNGLCFVLESVRVSQPSDIVGLSFSNNILPGNQAWVDNDGSGKWAVYEKEDPFTDPTEITAPTPVLDNRFGTSVAQGFNTNLGALVGAVGNNSGKGALYTFNKSDATSYVSTGSIALDTTELQGLGNSLDIGNNEWAVAGASQSESTKGYALAVNRNNFNGDYLASQLFNESTVSATGEFGHSVTISRDERWMYVAAPGDDTVYAYNRVDVQTQSKEFVGDGETITFPISDVILVDDDSSTDPAGGIGSQQLGVLLNNIPKNANVDWEYENGNIIFTVPPNTGDEIRISRLRSKTFFPSTATENFEIQDLYTATNIYSFAVYVDDVIQRPGTKSPITGDYYFEDNTVKFHSGVTGTVLINSNTHWQLVDTIVSATPGIQFGSSISCTTDGRQIIIGAPASDSSSGQVFIYDRSVERFQVSDASIKEYTARRTPNGPVTVKLNNQFLLPGPNSVNNNSQFSVSGNIITIDNDVQIAVGDLIEIETNTFKLMQALESNNSQENARFGEVVDQCSTNCSVYIGMPNDSSVIPEGGSVERWQNQNRLYGTITGNIANPSLNIGDTIRINNYDVELTGTTVADLVDDINNQDIPNVIASVDSGKLLLTLVDASAADNFIKLVVLPGLGTAFSDLGIEPMAFSQTLLPPTNVAYGHFGKTLQISDTATTLVVGAPDSTAVRPTTFDDSVTRFDSSATEYFDLLPQSGVVYTYDLLPAANPTVNNSAQFVFGQQIFDESLESLDKFGTSVSYVGGILLIGAPQDDLQDSTGDFGRVTQLSNANRVPAWKVLYQQTPIVDASLINSVFTYNRLDNVVTQYLDYIDPLQGKILGSARQNIDYILATDPASYNTGTVNNRGTKWDSSYVGKMWWDVSSVRFIDYHQDTLEYRAKRWGQLFPGSSVDIYQWIESNVPPARYTGPGEVFNTESYVISSELEIDGSFNTVYYYWVKGLANVNTNAGKTLSASAVAQYIESPKSSGIPYIAAINPSTVSLYNCRTLISADDTVLHIEFDKEENSDNVHVEYDLVADGKANSFLGEGLYRKMLDSFCGADTVGNNVPDDSLSIADKYGVNFRPRQSFFVNRFLALENYLTRANNILAQFPISDSRSFNLLNSEESEPTSVSGAWNLRLETYAELTFQDLRTVPVGYKYLVASDSTNKGLWTIYTVQSDKSLLLSRVQNYDTKLFWEYIDWVQPGYNANIKPSGDVDSYSDLLRLTNVAEGTSYKVNTNSFGKFEIYQYTSGEWARVVLEDGTVSIKSTIWDYTEGRFGFDVEVFDAQRYDQNPIIETRQILQALNQEIFIGDLEIYKNQLLILVFEYIFTEQQAPDWLFKTSLIDVDHKIRDLEPFQVFRRDNQDFVLDYINEVKPYHVKIKEFNLRYEGQDDYTGNMTDFDLPAFYDESIQRFISPILDDNVDNPVSLSSFPSTDPIWSSLPWSQWYNNYLLSLEEVDVVNSGSGYTVPPQVTVTGTATRDAVLRARINTAGQVVEIIVEDAGEGYLVTPVITISGGNGTGAIAVPVMNNQMVRSFDTTIKFDRYEYTSTVQDWQPNTNYEEGSLVRFNNVVYSVNQVADSSELLSGATFDPQFYTEVDQSTLSGADRTIGLYVPDSRNPGRELAQLLSGISYPGVQVNGPNFNQNTGYDIGNFDITPFDNIDIGPEGFPTYSEEILDTVYESSFLDTYLGTRSTDINVDGGGFVDTYSSHAPEELVPGAVFDTLSLKVYTRPGADWLTDGHGFDIKGINRTFDSLNPTIDISGYLPIIANVIVVNRTTEIQLLPSVNFTVDWLNQTVTIIGGVVDGNIIEIKIFSPGGGTQLFRNTYSGDEVNKRGEAIIVPVNNDEIVELLILKNGEIVSSDFYSVIGISQVFSRVQFSGISFNNTDAVTIVVLGESADSSIQRSWSYPLTESFIYDGTDTYTLTNSLDDSDNLKGTNEIDMIVIRNGERLRPPEAVQYIGDGSSAGPYYLPTRGEILQGLVAENDVKVYVDNVEKTLAIDWTLTPWDGSSDRYVEFATPPSANSVIKIAVTTVADYSINGDQLTLRVGAALNSIISVVTWNDTSEQQLLTQVFQGPTIITDVQSREPFDSIGFDSASNDDQPGSFDYTVGVELVSNRLDLGVEVLDSERIVVHKNGFQLTPNAEYIIDGTAIEISGSILGPGDVITVTTVTQFILPDGLQFQIFQDMLGNQKISRLPLRKTPFLSQSLTASDDVIHVTDASLLTEPDPANNLFGVVSIEGERITYRIRDVVNNTLSGLRRGVAGTAIADHIIPLPSGVEPFVRDESINTQLPNEYQKNVYLNTFIGDSNTRTFVATNLNVGTSVDSTELDRAVRVAVGGRELLDSEYTVDQIDPVQVTLTDTPNTGVEIIVYVVQSQIMYAPGDGTASNGIPLQEQTTSALKFLRGDI